MKLSEYLAKPDVVAQDLADEIGVHRSNLYRFANGTRRPDLGTVQKIEKATGGAVTAQDFFSNGAAA